MKNLPPVETFLANLADWIEKKIYALPGSPICRKEDMRQEMCLQILMTYNNMLDRDDVTSLDAVEYFMKQDMKLRLANLLAQTIHPINYKKASNFLNADEEDTPVQAKPSGSNSQSTLMDYQLNLRMDLQILIEKHDERGMMFMYYNGMSVPQIAEAIGETVRRTYYLFRKLREKFQIVLTSQGILPEVRYSQKEAS
jgi:hypothetical protein